MEKKIRIDFIRKNLADPSYLFLRGWLEGGESDDMEFRAYYDGEEVPVSYTLQPNIDPDAKSVECDLKVLWNDRKSLRWFTISYSEAGEKHVVLRYSIKELRKVLEKPNYCVDSVFQMDDNIYIRGWVFYQKEKSIQILSADGTPINAKYSFIPRADVFSAFPEIEGLDNWNRTGLTPGFMITLEECRENRVWLEVEADGRRTLKEIDLRVHAKEGGNRLLRLFDFYKNHGVSATLVHIGNGVKTRLQKERTPYEKWMAMHDLKKKERIFQASRCFERTEMFSIVVPLYNTPIDYLQVMIDSVLGQTYGNWELCLADGSDNDRIQQYLPTKRRNLDERIKYQKLEGNLGIAGNTNAALRLAGGTFIVLADHDDLLSADALYELMCVLERDEQTDVIYSDEDKVDYNGKVRYDPHFKPDYNIDFLCSVNYICHLFCVRADLINGTGNYYGQEPIVFDKKYDGAQDHDFILRCCERAQKIFHIPKILYHWRCHMNSTAENPEHKRYAFDAGKAAVAAHYQRLGYCVKVKDGPYLGSYHAVIPVQGEPMVSILIPNMDHVDDLDQCLSSIYAKSSYRNFEVIVIENNSKEEKTWEYYERMTDTYGKTCRLVTWTPPEGQTFNFSAINNYGVEFAQGEYLLFLNNDTEVINADWLEEMLGYCQRDDVGIVGAKLLYPDDTVQHAGVIIGMGRIAGHAGMNIGAKAAGYFFRSIACQDLSAVTAACLMTKKSLFSKVGGMNEELCVAFNDIDFCMRIRSLDKLVVFNPEVRLYHYESKSRGAEDTPEKIERFQGEIKKFKELWPDILTTGDPYYNVNLSLNMPGYKIKL